MSPSWWSATSRPPRFLTSVSAMSGGTSSGGRTPHCPTCGAELHLETGDLPAWLCPAGHGVAATLPAARKRVDDEVVTRAWAEARKASAGERSCPFCTKPMTPVAWTVDDVQPPASVVLDLCRADQLLWFDVGELELLPQQLQVADDDDEVWITNPWGEAAENLPDWTQRVVTRGIVRGFRP